MRLSLSIRPAGLRPTAALKCPAHLPFQIAHVIREVRNFQQVPYKIEHIPKVTNYLQDPSLVLDEDEMYRLSLDIEPRASRLSAANTAAIVNITSSHHRLFPSTSHDR